MNHAKPLLGILKTLPKPKSAKVVLMHVAKSAQRFWDNDMHKKQELKARRMNPFRRDAL
jgi:hypothetical protein